MRTQGGRTTVQIGVHQRRDDFAAVVEAILPIVREHAEQIGLFVMVCAFWGLILFTAATFAVP